MAQVTIYMDDDSVARMKAAAKSAGLSMSAWLAQLVQAKTQDTWPPEVVSLAGAWTDLPTSDELRSGQVTDVSREEL